MILLLSFRPMQARSRTTYSVPKIGKGSFSPLGPNPLLPSGRAAPTSHQAPGLGTAPVQHSKPVGNPGLFSTSPASHRGAPYASLPPVQPLPPRAPFLDDAVGLCGEPVGSVSLQGSELTYQRREFGGCVTGYVLRVLW